MEDHQQRVAELPEDPGEREKERHDRTVGRAAADPPRSLTSFFFIPSPSRTWPWSAPVSARCITTLRRGETSCRSSRTPSGGSDSRRSGFVPASRETSSVLYVVASFLSRCVLQVSIQSVFRQCSESKRNLIPVLVKNRNISACILQDYCK